MSVALNHAQYDAYRYTWQALRDAAARLGPCQGGARYAGLGTQCRRGTPGWH